MPNEYEEYEYGDGYFHEGGEFQIDLETPPEVSDADFADDDPFDIPSPEEGLPDTDLPDAPLREEGLPDAELPAAEVGESPKLPDQELPAGWEPYEATDFPATSIDPSMFGGEARRTTADDLPTNPWEMAEAHRKPLGQVQQSASIPPLPESAWQDPQPAFAEDLAPVAAPETPSASPPATGAPWGGSGLPQPASLLTPPAPGIETSPRVGGAFTSHPPLDDVPPPAVPTEQAPKAYEPQWSNQNADGYFGDNITQNAGSQSVQGTQTHDQGGQGDFDTAGIEQAGEEVNEQIDQLEDVVIQMFGSIADHIRGVTSSVRQLEDARFTSE
jgi:hypothetical protein